MSASPAAFLVSAAQATRGAGTARVTSTMTVDAGDGASQSVRADGVVDFAGDDAALRVSSSIFGGGSDLQILLVDSASYVQVPMFGEKWISVPLDDLNVELPDPSKGLNMLTELTDLTEVGEEPIDGTETTKYTGTVDVEDAVGMSLPADLAQSTKKELEKASGTVDVSVWVDGDGRVVRLDQRGTVDVGTGAPLSTTSSTTLTDFGVATDIAAPPADQVVDGSQLGGLADLPRTG